MNYPSLPLPAYNLKKQGKMQSRKLSPFPHQVHKSFRNKLFFYISRAHVSSIPSPGLVEFINMIIPNTNSEYESPNLQGEDYPCHKKSDAKSLYHVIQTGMINMGCVTTATGHSQLLTRSCQPQKECKESGNLLVLKAQYFCLRN